MYISEILENRETDFPPAECIFETLSYVWNMITLCNKKYYLKEDGIAMGPHIPCSYSDITMYRFDLKALSYTRKVLCWKKFRKRFGKGRFIFAVRNHSLQELHKFLQFMNSIDTSGKIKFTMSIANNNSVLEFLDLRLHINEHNKICVNVYAKPTNSLSYVLPSTCYPKEH